MAGKLPKYQKIRDQILQQIKDGVLQAGDRLPVRSEMISQYGVTRTTLDKALNDLIKNGTLVSAKRGGTLVAQAPQTRRRVGVVSRLSAVSMAQHHGMPNDVQRMLSSMILTAHHRADVIFLDEAQVLSDLEHLHDYDSVVWVQPSSETIAILEPWKNKIFITNRYPDSLNYVSTNHAAAVQAVTEYFIEHVHQEVDLYYVGSRHDNFITHERVRGFSDACKLHHRQFTTCTIAHDYEEGLHQLMQLPVHPDKTTVIICMSSYYEPVILAMAKCRGLHRGQNFFYADCDNDSIAQGHREAALTITQDYPQMGAMIMEAAIEGRPCQSFVPFTIKGSEQFLLGD